MKKYICEGLADYLAKDVAPWHMPGHKRKHNMNRKLTSQSDIELATQFEESHIYQAMSLAYKMDVTEVPGTDDLHHPEEMILKSQQELARIYGTYASYYMVNGSTGGILAAVGAVAQQSRGKLQNPTVVQSESELQNPTAGQGIFNPQIIIARNCHKSVYNAVQLFNLKPIYLEPQFVDEISCCSNIESKSKCGAHPTFGIDNKDKNTPHIYGGITPQQVKELVEEHPDVVAVVITSPTYEGIVSDVAGIKKVLEPYQIPLIVDEAHGAHLTFIDGLPKSAVDSGGDIVVQSLHKTLPALTQTAILHVNNPIYDDAVRKYLSVFMSSSPSYVMLCSMESAVACAEGRARSERGFDDYVRALREFRCKCENLQNLRLLELPEKQAENRIAGSQVMVAGESLVCDGKPVADEKLVCDGKPVAGENSAYREASIFAQDISRLVIYTCNEHIHPTGQQLQDALREYGGIESEMSGVDYVVLISTFADEEQDFDRLYEAMCKVDRLIESGMLEGAGAGNSDMISFRGESPLEAKGKHMRNADIEALRALVGTKSDTNIYVYPPGSYIVAAGEVITEAAVDALAELAESGKRLYGV